MAIRVGLLGCGRWGRNLARVLSAREALAAIAVRNPEPVRELAAQLGVELLSPADLLQRADIPAVAIATPPDTHAGLVRAALQAGKHVFVEKPLALSVEDARACADEARLAGRVLMTGHILRRHPAFTALAELVGRGVVGRLRHVISHRFSTVSQTEGDDPLWQLAPHDISMVLALCGPAEALTAATDGQRRILRTRHQGSVSAEVQVARGWPVKEQRLIVFGETGSIVFDDTAADRAQRLVLHDRPPLWEADGPRLPPGPGAPLAFVPGEPLAIQMAAFLEAARTGHAAIGGPDEAVAVVEVLARAEAALA